MKLHLGRIQRPARPARHDVVFVGGALSLLGVLLFLLAVPGLQRLQHSSETLAIRGNAATLQLAAESFAAANQGRYPGDAHDLLPWLPGDRPPRNPLNGQPVDFRAEAGGVTYHARQDGGSYVIEAYGASASGPAPVLIRLEGRSHAAIR